MALARWFCTLVCEADEIWTASRLGEATVVGGDGGKGTPEISRAHLIDRTRREEGVFAIATAEHFCQFFVRVRCAASVPPVATFDRSPPLQPPTACIYANQICFLHQSLCISTELRFKIIKQSNW